MNKEQKEILYELLDLMIKRHETTNNIIIELQKEIKLLNLKINILKNRQFKACCKGCCKCSK